MEFCVNLNFTQFQEFVECNSLRQSINGAISMLETALAEMNEQKLEAALNYCYDKKNFKGPCNNPLASVACIVRAVRLLHGVSI